jgi:HD-GYP domain-containing protein (c-di-GMP phosphodiesterase class II)
MGSPTRQGHEPLWEELARLEAQLTRREREVERRERALRRSYEATVRALADAVEARDAYTGKHAERVAAYGIELARAHGMPRATDPEIEFGFLLHDVGKVAISDAILCKPGPLTAPERTQMRRHPVIGEQIVRGIEFLGDARHVVRSHHERWDGAGYPDGLAGERIPLPARVFAVVDAFDALTSDRPYRKAVSFDEARAAIRADAGTQFDPDVARTFDDVPNERLTAIRGELR